MREAGGKGKALQSRRFVPGGFSQEEKNVPRAAVRFASSWALPVISKSRTAGREQRQEGRVGQQPDLLPRRPSPMDLFSCFEALEPPARAPLVGLNLDSERAQDVR